jgi:hypothetical protein
LTFSPGKHCICGRAIAEAVNRRLPTEVALVRSQLRSFRQLRFPLPILIPSNASYSSIIGSRYNRPISGRRIKGTQSHPTPRKLKLVYHTKEMEHDYIIIAFNVSEVTTTKQ